MISLKFPGNRYSTGGKKEGVFHFRGGLPKPPGLKSLNTKIGLSYSLAEKIPDVKFIY